MENNRLPEPYAAMVGVPAYHPRWGHGQLAYRSRRDVADWFVRDYAPSPPMQFINGAAHDVPHDLIYRLPCRWTGAVWLILHDWKTDAAEPFLLCPLPGVRWHPVPKDVRSMCE